MKKYLVTRNVPVKECHWLAEDVKAGAIVYKFHGATYGCIGPNGVAVTMNEDGDNPFFELPYNALEEYKSIVEE